MKGRKHTPEQIVRKLREADRMTAEGVTGPRSRRHSRSPSTPSTAVPPPMAG
jgi:hypothetical protein